MPNFKPIFPSKVNNGFVKLTTQTAAPKTGAGSVSLFVADATSGSRIDRLKAVSAGDCGATKLYIFNLRSAVYTLIGDVDLPASALSTTTKNGEEIDVLAEINMGGGMPVVAGDTIYVGLGAAVTDGWHISAWGGDYAP